MTAASWPLILADNSDAPVAVADLGQQLTDGAAQGARRTTTDVWLGGDEICAIAGDVPYGHVMSWERRLLKTKEA
jgi:hypothetical protein